MSVEAQPDGQVCSVANGAGTIQSATVSNIVVNCETSIDPPLPPPPPPPSTHVLGGNISGLIGTVTLANGNQTYTTSTDGTFEFETPIEEGAAYAVSVETQPAIQTCSVSHGAGTMGESAVDNVTVVCSTNTFAVGGSVSGLMGDVVVRNNGGDELTISNDGAFEFPIAVAQGSPYAVTGQAQPATQTCSVSHGTGTIGAGDISDVAIVCSTNVFNLGGVVSGLHGTVVLQNNGADDLSLTSDGAFTFPSAVAQGSPYSVTVSAQPVAGTCVVSNGTGTMGMSDIANVTVACSLHATTLSTFPNAVIPVHVGSGSLTVTNDGSYPAVNIGADLPPGWTSVVVDASDCVDLAPGASCDLKFSSSAPYVAQAGIEITADNVSSPPITTLGFSIDGFRVFAVESPTTATVVDNSTKGILPWADSGWTLDATSLTDGAANTSTLIADPMINAVAAQACDNSTEGGAVPGTWYLPAICQMSSTGGFANCPAGLPNLWDNLFRLNLNPIAQDQYWSSTNAPWRAHLFGAASSEAGYPPPDPAPVVCVRSISY